MSSGAQSIVKSVECLFRTKNDCVLQNVLQNTIIYDIIYTCRSYWRRTVINIAVVDDEEIERKKIRDCIRHIENDTLKFNIGEFESAEEFLMQYEVGYDIVFMDIRLGRTNGIDAAKILRKTDSTVIIIFVTNMAQLALKGYEVDALDFIVKPLNESDFVLKFKRALARISPCVRSKIIIKTDGNLVGVNASLLRYIEVDGHYVVYHAPNEIIREYITLSAAEKKISPYGIFVRCNRGQLVNMRYVSAIKKEFVIVDGEELLLARTQRNAFVKSYAKYISGGGRNV